MGRKKLGIVNTSFTISSDQLEWIDSKVTINKNRSVILREIIDIAIVNEKKAKDQGKSRDESKKGEM